MTIRTLTAFVAVILVSCAPAPREEVQSELKATPAPSAAPSPTAFVPSAAPAPIPLPTDAEGSLLPPSLAAGETGKDPELAPEDFEEGFCVDDLYGHYLTHKFEQEHPRTRQSSAEKRRPKRRGDGSMPTMDSLFYAKNRLTGKTTPYFGAIPVVTNERVALWIQYFKTSGRQEFMQWLVRGESVKRLVQPLLKDAGLPIEFFYLAMVESGFKNVAYSRKKATGTWQFMGGTARRYGLKMDSWVDERRDPVKSSIAAANLLKALYQEFGDWYLAMAAYNAGPGKVKRAIRAVGTRDFWALAKTKHLAKETKAYVPKVLAAILLAAEPKLHGFDCSPNPLDVIPDTEVIVKRPVRLDELARELKVPIKTLKQWNPELIRDVTPPVGNGGYALRLASTYANMFPSIERKLSLIEITDIQMHTVRKGDTLQRIAKLYKVDVKKIQALNPDLTPKGLRIGKQVAVPVPGVVSAAKQPKQA